MASRSLTRRALSKWVAVVSVLAVVMAACSSSPAPTPPPEDVDVTAVTPSRGLGDRPAEQPSFPELAERAASGDVPIIRDEINLLASILLILDKARSEGGYLVTGVVDSLEDGRLVATVNSLVDAHPDTLSIDGYNGAPVGKDSPVLLVVGRDAGTPYVAQVIPIDDDGNVQAANTAGIQPDSLLAFHSETFIQHVSSVAASHCAHATPKRYESLADALDDYLAGVTPRQVDETARAAAEDIALLTDSLVDAQDVRFTDETARTGVPVDDATIKGELESGVAPSDVTVGPTVPIFIDVTGIDAIETYVFVESGSDRLVGLLHLGPGTTTNYGAGGETNVLEAFLSPSTDALEVFRLGRGALTGCTSNAEIVDVARSHGTPALDIEPGLLDSSSTQRALINVAAGQALPVGGDRIAEIRGTG